MNSQHVVEVNNLEKTFGAIRALDRLSFTIDQSEIFGLIGPNGAGKTTTLRILATILTPTAGQAKVLGRDVMKVPEEVRSLLTYLPEEAGAYRNLSGAEYLRLMADLYPTTDTQQAFEEGARIAGLGDRLRDRIKTYSKGMKRRLLLARALMVKPKLAVLDEPTGGLDVVHAHHVRNIIKEYARQHGITVLLSSHNMLEVEYLCDRVVFIDRGRSIGEGSPKELKTKYAALNLEEVFVKVARLG